MKSQLKKENAKWQLLLNVQENPIESTLSQDKDPTDSLDPSFRNSVRPQTSNA